MLEKHLSTIFSVFYIYNMWLKTHKTIPRWPGNGSAEGNGHCKVLSPRSHPALAPAWVWPWTNCWTSAILCFFIWKLTGLALGTPVERKSMIHLWPTHLYPQIHQEAPTSIIYIHLQVSSAIESSFLYFSASNWIQTPCPLPSNDTTQSL